MNFNTIWKKARKAPFKKEVSCNHITVTKVEFALYQNTGTLAYSKRGNILVLSVDACKVRFRP